MTEIIVGIVLFGAIGLLIYASAKEHAEQKRLYKRKIDALEKIAKSIHNIDLIQNYNK